jgi:glutamyl-tRNA synthetase
VDDAEMGVTEVVRGDDLIPSTPRQLQLYGALNLQAPTFAHVPLVVGTDGRRLAKRHGDTRLASYLQQGLTPEEIVGYLAWSCGWQSVRRPISARELVSKFRWEDIPREKWVVGDSPFRAVYS